MDKNDSMKNNKNEQDFLILLQLISQSENDIDNGKYTLQKKMFDSLEKELFQGTHNAE